MTPRIVRFQVMPEADLIYALDDSRLSSMVAFGFGLMVKVTDTELRHMATELLRLRAEHGQPQPQSTPQTKCANPPQESGEDRNA